MLHFILLGIVSLLFIIICLLRCLPKFTQIMFSSTEQLSAVQRAQHTQRLSQILKRQHQLRAQQLARQSPNCLFNQQPDLLEKGIFQDPFLGAGVLGSVLLQPNRLDLSSANTEDKQQVNGMSKINGLNHLESNTITQQPTRKHQTFAVAGIAATAASHLLLNQQRNTLRKQLLAKQQKLSEQREKTLTPPLINNKQKPVLTRFLNLKKTNAVRPVQLQHSFQKSLSLTSFGLPKNGQLNSPLNNHSNNNKLKLTNEIKPNLKYNRIDKNVMTINQQPITLDILYKNKIPNKSITTVQSPDQAQFYSDIESNLIDNNLMNNRFYSKSVQNIEKQFHQPVTWLDQDSSPDELPAPLPLDIFPNKRRISKFNYHSPVKCRSMPMINQLNQPENALFENYYLDDEENSLNEHNLHEHHYPFQPDFSITNQQTNFSTNNQTCNLHSSINHLLHNTPEEFYQTDQSRNGLNTVYCSNNRINTEYNLEHQQWPDNQLQQFLNAFNHYTKQRPSVNRNHTRSLYDLY